MSNRYPIVRIDTKRVPSSELVCKGRNHVSQLTNNPAFPDPTPGLAEIAQACDELDVASQEYTFNRGRMELVARNSCHERLVGLIRLLAGYVQATAHGDRELILSTGFNIIKGRQPSEPMTAPMVRATRSAFPGSIDLRWTGVRNRKAYVVWINAGDPNNAEGWERLAITTKNHLRVEHLQTDAPYSFRLTAIGALGSSPLSAVATAKAA